MFERFTDRARRVLVVAQEEARSLDHNFIGTEHLLLGLTADDDTLAFRALAALGFDRVKAREDIVSMLGTHAGTTGSPPFTPRAKKVLELALREALQLGHNYIGGAHILLGVVREGEGVAAQVLISQGITQARARTEVLARLRDEPSEPGLAASSGRGSAMRRAGPGGPEPDEDDDAPLCFSCGADLHDNLRHRPVTARGDGGVADRTVTVLYCGHCGRFLGTA